MGHKYVKEDETFNTSRNGTVPKPTQADVTANKVLRADGSWVAQSGGGGSTVTITPTLSEGIKIADFEIDGNSGALYAPSGGSVALPECICKRTGYSGNRGFSESMQYLNISTGNVSFSVEAYFYISDASDGYILSFGYGDTHRAFGMGAGNIVTWGDDWSLPGTHTGLHHRVITYDGNVTFKTYQDGVLIDTHTTTSALNIASTSIYWGLWITGQYGVRGNVHYAKYYDKALMAEEVALLYANRNNQF